MKFQDLDCDSFGYEIQFSNPLSSSLERGQACKRCVGCHRCRMQKRDVKVKSPSQDIASFSPHEVVYALCE